MTTKSKLLEIQKLVNKTQLLVSALVDSQPRPTPGKPPQPRHSQRIEMGIWKAWPKLASRKSFTVSDVKELVGQGDSYLKGRSDSAYSSTLSRWAREGHIKISKQGSGPSPTIYTLQ